MEKMGVLEVVVAQVVGVVVVLVVLVMENKWKGCIQGQKSGRDWTRTSR